MIFQEQAIANGEDSVVSTQNPPSDLKNFCPHLPGEHYQLSVLQAGALTRNYPQLRTVGSKQRNASGMHASGHASTGHGEHKGTALLVTTWDYQWAIITSELSVGVSYGFLLNVELGFIKSVVKILPSSTRGVGSNPGQRTKTPHALGPKNQNTKQKQYWKQIQ